jgi:hypothetical protein
LGGEARAIDRSGRVSYLLPRRGKLEAHFLQVRKATANTVVGKPRNEIKDVDQHQSCGLARQSRLVRKLPSSLTCLPSPT